jgi:hypothetical protein
MLTQLQTPTLSNQAIQHFTLWDGEMGVTVIRHLGLHGFTDAVVVVRKPDSPMQVLQYNAGYYRAGQRGMTMDERIKCADDWVVVTLQQLSTRTRYDEVQHKDVPCGEYCEIVAGDNFLFD